MAKAKNKFKIELSIQGATILKLAPGRHQLEVTAKSYSEDTTLTFRTTATMEAVEFFRLGKRLKVVEEV